MFEKRINSYNQKIFLTGAVLLFSAAIASCSKDSEKLAEFKDGSVTRKEFRMMLSFYQDPETVKSLTVEQQDSTLKNFALMKLAAALGRKEKLDKDPEYEKRRIFSDEWVSVAAYDAYLKQDLLEKAFEFLDIQLLFLRNEMQPANPADPKSAASPADRSEEANALLKKLNSGLSDREIEDLIKDKSENPRYASIGGYIDPQCISCKPNNIEFLLEPLKTAKAGEFVIHKDATGYWIFRKVRSHSTRSDGIEAMYRQYLENTNRVLVRLSGKKDAEAATAPGYLDPDKLAETAKAQAQGMVRREFRSALKNKIDELQKGKKLVIHDIMRSAQTDPKFTLTDETTPLFSVGDKTFTYKDVHAPFKAKEVDIPVREELRLVERVLIPYYLVNDQEDFKKMQKSDLFSFLKELKEDEAIAGIYIMKNRPVPEVSDAEIQQWFTLRQNDQYKGKSLNQVKEEIREGLKGKKEHEMISGYQDKLAKDNNLKINTDRLKAGHI
jgi:hypothetical protein